MAPHSHEDWHWNAPSRVAELRAGHIAHYPELDSPTVLDSPTGLDRRSWLAGTVHERRVLPAVDKGPHSVWAHSNRWAAGLAPKQLEHWLAVDSIANCSLSS